MNNILIKNNNSIIILYEHSIQQVLGRVKVLKTNPELFLLGCFCRGIDEAIQNLSKIHNRNTSI